MQMLFRYLAGPELMWIIASLVANAVRRMPAAKTGQFNNWIESYSVFLPVLLMALTMFLYAIPWEPKKYLMLRIILAAFIGTHFVIDPVLNSHSVGGPGVGTIYLVAYILIIIAIPVSIIVKVLFIK